LSNGCPLKAYSVDALIEGIAGLGAWQEAALTHGHQNSHKTMPG